MYISVITLMTLNFITILSCLVIMKNEALKDRFFRFPMVVQKMYVILIVVPIFCISLLNQPTFLMSAEISLIFGIGLIIGAVIAWGTAFLKIGIIPSVRKKNDLITGGIYGIVRNPIYTGLILCNSGLVVLFKGWFALGYGALVIVLFSILCLVEEEGLKTDYGAEYSDYQAKVRYRLIPFIF